ncbi:MAG: hypothetical protein H6830_07985 [Planctomycetes bacterium]|nr:hypothetical protein [Planctomycetota bacterium]MCB9909784.1 hypothetical protein [Planctomycetota bacterium]MCB9912307.1 hypothetical protein [Planctomycetota bacterium]
MSPTHRSIAYLLALLAGPPLSNLGWSQSPDLVVSQVATNNGWTYYGQTGGLAAYSFRNTTCNLGNLPLDWSPVVVENLYLVRNGHIEQVAASFGLHKVCAVNETGCGTCQPTGCSTLGIGCGDTSAIHDGASGWARWQINGNTGTWSGTPVGPCCEPAPLAGRVFAPIADLTDPSLRVVAEAQFVSAHDQSFGNGANNASWTAVQVAIPSNPQNLGSTHIGEPAIFAWQTEHPDVQLEALVLLDEGGPGYHGFLWLGSRATDLGGGLWRYDYAVQNLTCERAIGSLTIHSPCPQPVASTVEFRGAPQHSGSPYASTPWAFANTAGDLTWSTEPYASDPDANALRWGTLMSCSFESTSLPSQGSIDLGLFQPGVVNSLSANGWVPTNAGFEYPSYCTALPTTLGSPIDLQGSGTPVIAAANLHLSATSVPPNNFGYFLMGNGQLFTPLPPGSQGNLCLGGSIYRFHSNILNSGPFGAVAFQPRPTALPPGAVWSAGDTWNFQYWTRDWPGLSNFSNVASITFCE